MSQKKARTRLTQSEVLFQLADHGTVVHQVICPSRHLFCSLISKTVQVFDRAIVDISDEVYRTSILFALVNWVSEEHGITHYRSDCLQNGVINQRQPSNCNRCAYDSTIIRHFRSTANSKYRRRKHIRIGEKLVYTTKLSEFKSSRIQSFHFRFRIQNLRRHDQTG